MGPDSVKPTYRNAEVGEMVESALEEASKVTGTAGIDVSQFSFKWVHEQLEEAHVGKELIFCKDMAHAVTDRLEFIPKGYRHLFLIRHPMKVFLSWKKLFQAAVSNDAFCLDDMSPPMFPKGFGFKEMTKLLDHVKDAHDQEAMIIDADDLLQDPKGILSALFKAIGLPFDEKILQWEAGDAIVEQWVVSKQFLQGNQLTHFYQNALDSTCFLKPRPPPDRSSLSADILRLVDATMPHYEKMYVERLAAQ